MTMTDPIADMLTRIRNAQRASHESVDIPSSKMKVNIAKVLKAEGYIKNFRVMPDGKQGILRIFLKYDEQGRPVIEGLKRISKPSRKVYAGYDEIPKVLNGFGISIVSTSKGIMADKKARKMKVGGEILCAVW
ncbi:MAG: 30S ribosomal protein S8 [Deltaproteobacteria bacterium]|nr:30S ribosomal protein S8 [Deltaproteobacteria bacterium]MBW2083457.1 30S ribosomal protein S8 [Deltaproteobacteria bacterium]HDM09042.1 30S ribosomal protein S8 [Desulfobacteraceae bacterium]